MSKKWNTVIEVSVTVLFSRRLIPARLPTSLQCAVVYWLDSVSIKLACSAATNNATVLPVQTNQQPTYHLPPLYIATKLSTSSPSLQNHHLHTPLTSTTFTVRSSFIFITRYFCKRANPTFATGCIYYSKRSLTDTTCSGRPRKLAAATTARQLLPLDFS